MTHLKPGDDAPDFEAPIQTGKIISLKKYTNRKLILFFYPQDNTPTCTIEACALRDGYKKLRRLGYNLLGISADSLRKHNNFIQKFDLPFDLISDPDLTMIKAYGVWGWKKFMGREFEGIIRTTFIIGKDGKISHVIDKVKSAQHADQIVELVKS